MRRWIQHLIDNAGACSDFAAWCEEIDRELKASLHEAVLADKMNEAKSIAAEMEVYKNLRQKVQAELRERNSQVSYQAAQEGGTQ